MNWKNHIGLLIAGGIVVLLVAGAAALLFVSRSGYVRTRRAYQDQKIRYERLVQREPFPSQENVERARENLDELREYAGVLRTALQTGQMNPEKMERAEFPPLAERVLRGLWEVADDNKVQVPENFAFGFRRYIEGDIPAAQHIPRLVAQLRTVDALCRLLFSARISALRDITREEFDLQAVREEPEEDARTRRRRRPARREAEQETVEARGKSTDLYDVESFTLTFRARENALWDLLNKMASSDMFVVVTSIEFTSPVTPVSPISFREYQIQRIRELAGARLTPLQQERVREIEALRDGDVPPPPIDERVVAGREEVTVIMKCDVYRFHTEEMEDVRR